MSLLSASGQGKETYIVYTSYGYVYARVKTPISLMLRPTLLWRMEAWLEVSEVLQQLLIIIKKVLSWDAGTKRWGGEGGRLNKGPIFPEWKGHFSSMGLQILNALIRRKIIRWTTRLSKTQSRHPFTLLIYISYMNSHHPSPWFQNAHCLITSQ